MAYLFGEKLRRARLERQLTQIELAQRLSLASHSHIAKLEANEDVPSLSLVVRAAQLLQVSTDYLLRNTVPVEPILVVLVVDGLNVPITQRFGIQLKLLRLQYNLSQRELAAKLGLTSRAYISSLEAGQGKLPSIEVVIQIADLFAVTTDYLLQSGTVDVAM